VTDRRVTKAVSTTNKMVSTGETHGYKPTAHKPARPVAKPPAPPSGQGGGSKKG
jgi:hypothetical protein